MKVIVTGSSGFIGKELVKRLERSHEVICIDRKIGLDVADINKMDLNFQGGYVFHLAGQTSVWNNDIDAIIHDNIKSFKEVVEFCNRTRSKLIYASSSCAHNVTSMYGISKRLNEDYARIYCPTATGVRFHNVYGADPREGTLLNILLNDPEVTLWNNGANRRRFTYIEDIIEGLMYATSCNRTLINVCNPETDTVLEFVEEVAKYARINYKLSDQIRPLDKEEQRVDKEIHTVPLNYRNIREGINRVMEQRRGLYGIE